MIMKRFRVSLLRATLLLMVASCFVNVTAPAVFALSAGQQQIYNSGSFYFDQDVACGAITDTPSLTGNDNAEKGMNYFEGQGLTATQAAALLGNFKIESGIDPGSQQAPGAWDDMSSSRGEGVGIAQWDGGRRPAFINYAQAHGVTVDQLKQGDDQALAIEFDYVWHELNTAYQSTLTNLKKTSDVQDGVVVILIYYEGAADHSPTGQNATDRTNAAQQILAAYGSGAQPGSGSTTTTSTSTDSSGCSSVGAGSSFRLASFNICYEQCKADWQGRLKESVQTITSNNLDVVGLQEVRPDQWSGLHTALGSSYDFYPATNSQAAYPIQNSVIWNKNKFSLEEGKSIAGPHVSNGQTGWYSNSVIQAKLRDNSSGQEFYVINTHEYSGNGAGVKGRYDSAKRWASYIKQLSTSGTPIFMTGDFNSKYSAVSAGNLVYQNKDQNTAYCVLTSSGVLWDAYDAANNKTGNCPSTSYSPPAGDHIFMSNSVNATNYDYTSMTAPGNGSDVHNTLAADVVIPGAGDVGVGKGDFTNGSQTYPGVQQMLARAKEISNNNSALFHQVCNGSTRCYHRCDHLVAGAWGHSSSGYATAMSHWAAMKAGGHAHPADRTPPVGALLFYDTGESAGHVALYLGNNKILSNDVNGNGGAYIVDASAMESGPWRLTYLGWSDPVFGG
jgi:endonuclease/exonuclease/phosphatase family metal-dependent hydrolase